MHSTGIVFFLIIMSLGSIPPSESQSSSPVLDMFVKTLIRTFETPITVQDDNSKVKFSVDVMLANDVFTLDDALRLFIQQFIIALFNGRIDHFPDDWETRFPAYGRVINEVNNLLDIIAKRPLPEITMKDIRPLVKSLTLTALVDLQRLKTLAEDADKAKEEKQAASNEDL